MSFGAFDKNGNQRDPQWLEATYKVKFLDAGPGPKFRLVRVDETEGPAVFIAQVRKKDGSVREAQVRLVVKGDELVHPVVGTRPPTVALTPQNVAQLRTYPRPPMDNGIGLHFHLDLRDEFIERTVKNLKSIRTTWTLIYAQDELQAERAARACFRAGVLPVVRIGRLVNEGFDPVPYVAALRRALQGSGFPHDPAKPPLYVQISARTATAQGCLRPVGPKQAGPTTRKDAGRPLIAGTLRLERL